MSFALIQTTLDAALRTVVGLPELQTENARLNRSGSTTPYARATLLPSETVQLTVGATGKDRALGLYQVDLNYPIDTGVATLNAMVDAVLAAFPRGILSTSSGQLNISTAWREPGTRDSAFYTIPIVVRWSFIA